MEYRKKHKLSYYQLAVKCKIFNINPSANMFRYCNGQRIPKRSEMEKIWRGTDKQVEPNDFYDFIKK